MEKIENIMLKYFLKIGIGKEICLPMRPTLKAHLKIEKNGERKIILIVTGHIHDEYKKVKIIALDDDAFDRLKLYNSKTKENKGGDFMKWFLLFSSRRIKNCAKLKQHIVIICNVPENLDVGEFLENNFPND